MLPHWSHWHCSSYWSGLFLSLFRPSSLFLLANMRARRLCFRCLLRAGLFSWLCPLVQIPNVYPIHVRGAFNLFIVLFTVLVSLISSSSSIISNALHLTAICVGISKPTMDTDSGSFSDELFGLSLLSFATVLFPPRGTGSTQERLGYSLEKSQSELH